MAVASAGGEWCAQGPKSKTVRSKAAAQIAKFKSGPTTMTTDWLTLPTLQLVHHDREFMVGLDPPSSPVESLGGQPKERSPSLAPGPLIRRSILWFEVFCGVGHHEVLHRYAHGGFV